MRGVYGTRGDEVFAEFCGGFGLTARGKRAEADGEGVVAGDDVPLIQ